MSERTRCGLCGFVFPKITRRKKCLECGGFGWITTFTIYSIDKCPLCSHFIAGKTQHNSKDEFCPLCDSHIETVRTCIVQTSMGTKLDLSSYELAVRIRKKQIEQWEDS